MKTAVERSEVQGNFNGTPYTLDPTAVGHLMDLLSGNYVNIECAVIREYATNALDAHREAGVTRPIEVTLPTALSPYLIVRDFGDAMTREALNRYFTVYGASSKNRDNEGIGGFGIGCKVAFALETSFTVVSIANGEKTVAMCERDANGTPEMHIVAHTTTDEPNGVTITVGVEQDSIKRFHAEAKRLFSFWQPGTVLVDGQQPNYILEGAIEVAPDEYFLPDAGPHAKFTIIMGETPYPVDPSVVTGNYHKIVRVPIGAFKISPTREGLSYTTATYRRLKELQERVDANIARHAQVSIDAEPTILHGAHSIGSYGRWFGIDSWRGEKIAAAAIPSSVRYQRSFTGNSFVMSRYRDAVTPEELDTTLFITNVPENRIGQLARAVHDFRSVEGALPSGAPLPTGYTRTVAVAEGAPTNSWLQFGVPNTPLNEITYTEFDEAVKAYRAAKRQVRGRNLNEVIYEVENVQAVSAATPSTLNALGIPIFYCWSDRLIRSIPNLTDPHAIVVLKPNNSLDRFLKRVPTAKSVYPIVADTMFEQYQNLSQTKLERHVAWMSEQTYRFNCPRVNDSVRRLLEQLPQDLRAIPVIQKFLDGAEYSQAINDFMNQMRLVSGHTPKGHPLVAVKKLIAELSEESLSGNLLAAYPLLNLAGRDTFPNHVLDHVTTYLRATQAAEAEKDKRVAVA